MAGDETEIETLKVKVSELEAELATTKHELDKSKEEVEKGSKALAKTQRQLDKSNSYNNDLRQQIETLSCEIQEFRASRRDMLHVGVQAVAEEILTEQGEKPLPQWENGGTSISVEETTDKATSIAESLKQTAEAALAQSGFVFDDNTGLYYDYNSGYYYNCEQGLYYDPASGTYFYYDDASGEYTFHSQVAPQQYTCPTNQSVLDGDKGERKRKKSKEKKKRERDSEDRRKKKKRKREKENEDKSKSTRKSKKKSKKRKHRSHHKKGGNSVCSNTDMDVPTAREDTVVPRDRQKLSSVKDEPNTLEKIKKRTKVKYSESEELKGKSKRLCDKDVDMLGKDNSDSDEGEVGDDDDAVDGDVEMGEIVDSPEEGGDTETVDKETLDDVGELSPNSLATGESELESGELTSDTEEDSSSSSSSESSEEEETFIVVEEELEDVSGSWPPCIRVMVTESDCLPEGTLFIVTCDGATIGREKDMNHLIRIPDINVSKMHAEIQYDYDAQSYVVIDVGSQNGTFLNSKCISETKCEQSMRALSHGDTLQMGSTTLLLHIHPGTDTCDDCEPGQVLGRLQAQEKANREVVIQSKADRQKEARHQLKQIKKRYGLENSAYVDNVSALKNPAYQDKAATRRREVGSDNPHVRDEAPASVMKPISTENKGRKLLAKMGWKEGQGLGKDNAGIAEPINVMLRTNQSAGLGSGAAVAKTLDDVHSVKKSQRWLQAQQRYNKLEKGPVDLSKPTNISFAFKKGPTVSVQPKVDLGTGESDEEEGEKSDSELKLS